MKAIYSTVFVVLLSILFVDNNHAQNQMNVAQYMFHQSFINPAAAGSYEDLNAALLVRQQWVGFDGAPKLNAFNVNMPLLKASVGLSVMHQKIGVHKNTQLFASYAYRVKMATDQYLSFGISAGVLLIRDDYNSVNANEGNDVAFMMDESETRADFQFGMYYFSNNYYIGLAIPSLLNNQIYFDPVEREEKPDYNPKYYHYYLQGGYEFELNQDWDLNVSSLLKYLVNNPLDADFNSQVRYRKTYGAGFSYRTTDEILAFVNVRLNRMFKVGYAYQYSFGFERKKLNSHEVMLIFSIDQPVRATIQSPRF